MRICAKKHNLPEINSAESYATYLKAIAKDEKGITAFGAKPADGWKFHELDQTLLEQNNNFNLVDASLLPLAYKLDDASGKVFNIYDTPEFTSLLQYYKDLADNGAWSKNVVSNKKTMYGRM
ncbi:hypothetical protein ACFSQ7_36775 [Paenibacillus rhizoplanae]